MSSDDKRTQLVDALTIQFRYVSANSVMFSQAVAAKVGIHSTDSECLDFLVLNGPATAGQLSQLTGLTTGAVTAVIDRLEKAGFVKREHSKEDRRKVMVIPNVEKIMTEIAPHMAAMGTGLASVCNEFSEAELETVLRFIEKTNTVGARVISEARIEK